MVGYLPIVAQLGVSVTPLFACSGTERSLVMLPGAAGHQQHNPASQESRDQAGCTAVVGIVLRTKLRAQQRLLRADACEDRCDRDRCEQNADSGTKSQPQPSELTSSPR